MELVATQKQVEKLEEDNFQLEMELEKVKLAHVAEVAKLTQQCKQTELNSGDFTGEPKMPIKIIEEEAL